MMVIGSLGQAGGYFLIVYGGVGDVIGPCFDS